MRYPDFIEFRAFSPETQPLVESRGRRLCVQVHLGETSLGGEFHEATHDCDAGAGAAILRQYCDAANLTGRLQSARANCVTFCRDRAHISKHVYCDRIDVVQFLALRDALLLDENRAPHLLDRRRGHPCQGAISTLESAGPGTAQ